MRDEYRGELAAAHDRIAQLEEKVAALETELRGGSQDDDAIARRRNVARLEAEVDVLRKRAVPDRRKAWAALTVPVLVLAIIQLERSDHASPLWLLLPTAMTVFTIAFMVIERRGARSLARRALQDAERRLAEARSVRRIDDVAAHGMPRELHMRIGEHQVEEDATGEPAAAARTHRS
jgi:hypothetical protein